MAKKAKFGRAPAKKGARKRVGPRPPRQPDMAPPQDGAPPQGAGPQTTTIALDDGAAKVTVRFYCQGIGDCHLLRFRKADGKDFWMLIDCGIHSSVSGGTATINNVVDNILLLTKRLDVVVVTHEHWDHISGFRSAREKFAQFEVGDIWMGWTENPEDQQALDFDKFKGAATEALQMAHKELKKKKGLTPHLSNVEMGLGNLLGFNFGAKGEKVRDARDAAVGLLKKVKKPKYLEPTTTPFQIEGLPNMRIYVLGPPRDTKMFGITERASEMYELGSGGVSAMVRALKDPFGVRDGSVKAWDDFTSPFDYNEGFCLADLLQRCEKPGNLKQPARGRNKKEEEECRKAAAFLYEYYAGPGPRSKPDEPSRKGGPVGRANQSSRRIDGDWLSIAADLGIQLDSRTNNSSLVLAFEFLDTRRVMLFVGDAQVGNWLSWKDVKWTINDKNITAYDLLARTVFYKVGHHGSHNATLKQKGLELMVHPDLSAFIPTNQADAKNVGWGQMPFKSLLADLEKRSNGRVIRADDQWLKSGGQPPFKASGAIKAMRQDQKGLWVELDIG